MVTYQIHWKNAQISQSSPDKDSLCIQHGCPEVDDVIKQIGLSLCTIENLYHITICSLETGTRKPRYMEQQERAVITKFNTKIR